MGIVVRLFFLMVLASMLLSVGLGWIAVLRARAQLGKSFGFGRRKEQDKDVKIIEGEYKVLDEDNRK